jgi:hypothetical protein
VGHFSRAPKDVLGELAVDASGVVDEEALIAAADIAFGGVDAVDVVAVGTASAADGLGDGVVAEVPGDAEVAIGPRGGLG